MTLEQQDFCLEIMCEKRNRLDPEAQRCRRLYNKHECDHLMLSTILQANFKTNVIIANLYQI